MRDYTAHASLAGLVLEESYVLGVTVEPGLVCFTMDFALGSDHPKYSPPEAPASYSARTGTLIFTDVSSLTWTGQGAPPATDASGERDYGNIDSLQWDEGHYSLEGDWGQMQVDAGQVEIVLTP